MRCYEYIHRFGVNPFVEDTDQDGVPDAWEENVGLKVGTAETTDLRSVWTTYAPEESDREVFARLCEEGVQGPMGSDWADDGLQWISAPPDVCQRTVVRDRSGKTVASLSALPGTPVSSVP